MIFNQIYKNVSYNDVVTWYFFYFVSLVTVVSFKLNNAATIHAWLPCGNTLTINVRENDNWMGCSQFYDFLKLDSVK